MPPSVASAPGSIGKKSPVSCRLLIELLARDAGLDRDVEIVRH
jgi:hypothetical protein